MIWGKNIYLNTYSVFEMFYLCREPNGNFIFWDILQNY